MAAGCDAGVEEAESVRISGTFADSCSAPLIPA
jgi:hypothetical protein